MISPIVWKEWHEQRWKMAFGTVMLVFFTGSMAAARVLSAREAATGVWVFGGMILSLYSAMGVFAPERTGGTVTFLASKPLDPRAVFLTKWFFGWLNIILPMAACGLLIVVLEGSQVVNWDAFVVRPAVGASVATMFYTMTCCLAPRRWGEAQVGFFGLMVLLAYFLHMVICTHWVSNSLSTSLSAPVPAIILGALNPLDLLAQLDPGGAMRAPIVIPVQLILFTLVMWIGLGKWQRSA